jgi:DUF917 family protein
MFFLHPYPPVREGSAPTEQQKRVVAARHPKPTINRYIDHDLPILNDDKNDDDKYALKDIQRGAAFLSAGGGGPNHLGNDIINTLNNCKVAMASLEDVPDHAYAVVSAYLGSPTAAAQLQHPTFSSLQRAIDALQRTSGHQVDFVVPGEMGAVNSLAPILAAHDLQVPVVDADGCGRAVPLLGATTFGLQDNLIAAYGAGMANDAESEGNYQSAVLAAKNIGAIQSAAFALISSSSYNLLGAAALWMMTGKELKQFAVPLALTRARAIGSALRQASSDYPAVLLRALERHGLNGRVLFDGALLTLEEFSVGDARSNDKGALIFRSLKDPAEAITVYTYHENILAYSNKHSDPVLMSPDMLCWLGEDGSTFDNSELQSKLKTIPAEKPRIYAIGVEATQQIGATSFGKSRISFRDDPGIQRIMLALMSNMGYAGNYVPFAA